MFIVIPGAPMAQPRLRHFQRGGFAQVYDPALNEKKRIREYLKKIRPDDYVMPEYPVISITWYMPIPSSMPARLKKLAQTNSLRHVKKPDTDNLLKLLFDTLSGIWIRDDSELAIRAAVKVYSPVPRTEILLDHANQLWDGAALVS